MKGRHEQSDTHNLIQDSEQSHQFKDTVQNSGEVFDSKKKQNSIPKQVWLNKDVSQTSPTHSQGSQKLNVQQENLNTQSSSSDESKSEPSSALQTQTQSQFMQQNNKNISSFYIQSQSKQKSIDNDIKTQFESNKEGEKVVSMGVGKSAVRNNKTGYFQRLRLLFAKILCCYQGYTLDKDLNQQQQQQIADSNLHSSESQQQSAAQGRITKDIKIQQQKSSPLRCLPSFKLFNQLLPEVSDLDEKITLILDLDETLVHSSFKKPSSYDYEFPVDLMGNGQSLTVYVIKRPGLEFFLQQIHNQYEVVVFTASQSKYADPLLTYLDKVGVIKHRLFRESCRAYHNTFVKDLANIGRDLSRTVLVDNSPHSFKFQPNNAILIDTFIDQKEDRELIRLLPILESMQQVPDVRQVCGDNLLHFKQQIDLELKYQKLMQEFEGQHFFDNV